MEQLLAQQHEAHLQGDYRLVWVCQQKIDRIKLEYLLTFLSCIG